ncbi:uncharacterized protein BP5553_00503 [Venustampulla echinocandica]|uniref:Uncharacterized protein n=1 Tax=Venustampulla echinocandica TaxID=2656787 RepID=A0A370TYD6_9HELO|nr:uncharacterized protein BP5553_00503 [Venustampulla echinocandica]RDL40524.1 hypothetical protein BP5553_00503 [Venustampulla echinocandica]
MDQEPFSYEPLQPRHIRVLEVESGRNSSELISCRCIHVSIDNPSSPPYVAVSYTWGTEPQKPHRILVNGRLLSTTQTVHELLRSKCMAEPDISLWIDAICINQDDNEEKSVQVTLMGEVYSNADRVRIWLGPSGENSGLAISFTETLCSILPEIETLDPERTMYYARKYQEGCSEWFALAKLLSRPWFTRTWVVQEVALSTNADIVCGDDTLSWNSLARAITGLGALGYGGMIALEPGNDLISNIGVPGLTRVTKLEVVRKYRRQREPVPLLLLMSMFSDAETKDLLDRVYGYLGVATDVDDPIFVPDYTETNSPKTLFTSVSRFLLARDPKLHLLRWSGITEESGAPSWSFNFVDIVRRRRLGNYPVTAANRQDIVFSNDGSELTLRGIIIDSISQLGLVAGFDDPGHTLGSDETANYYEWYLQAKSMFQSTALGQDEEVFWRTLLANKVNNENVLSDEEEAAPDQKYAEFLRDFESIMARISTVTDVEEAKKFLLAPEGMNAMAFRADMISASRSRRFCVLHEGSVGLMPERARPGDLIAAFLGTMVLFVIRPVPDAPGAAQKYYLIGECYVHNSMNGQVDELGLEMRDMLWRYAMRHYAEMPGPRQKETKKGKKLLAKSRAQKADERSKSQQIGLMAPHRHKRRIPAQKGRSDPQYWTRLPAEISLMILDMVAEDYRFQPSEPRLRAGYATICREWQPVFEQRNFQRLILDQNRICNLEKFTGKNKRRDYLEHLFLRVRLDEYDCTVCQFKEDINTKNKNNNCFSRAVWRLLIILSKWSGFVPSVGRYGRRKKGLILELGAYSPSDCKHTFRDFHLEPNYPYLEPRDLDEHGEAYKQRAERLELESLNDPFHGWVDGKRDVNGVISLEAKQRIIGTLQIKAKLREFARFDATFPKAEVVTGLLIRRQFYRKISAYSLSKLLRESFTCLEWLRHEGWHDIDTQQQAAFEKGLQQTLAPRTGRQAWACKSGSGKALSKASRSLNNLSAAFLVDARDFFADFWPPNHWSPHASQNSNANVVPWENLRKLTLTSHLLHPTTKPAIFRKLLTAVGRAAAFMPKLEVLEIWNATLTYDSEPLTKDEKGAACVFQYVYSSKSPKITFASTWFRENLEYVLGSNMEYCWANLPRHGPGNQLTIVIGVLSRRPSWFKHHDSAMTLLGVRGHVLHKLSRYQSCFEYKKPKTEDLEPNIQPAGA